MADRYWVDVFVGGMSEAFIEAFIEEFSVQETYEGVVEGAFGMGVAECTLEDVSQMEKWLQARNVPYLIHEEGKYEVMPAATWWRPGWQEHKTCITNTDFDPVITLEEARSAVAENRLHLLPEPMTLAQLVEAASPPSSS